MGYKEIASDTSIGANIMDREQIIDQLLNAFLALRQTLEQQIQTINDQIDQARLEYLKDLLDRQQRELADWLLELTRA